MTQVQIKQIIEALTQLGEDTTVPRNVRSKIESAIKTLNEDTELSLKIDKAIQYLDDISNDTNIQPYTRTQIWNIVSLLEATQLLF